MRVEFIPVVHVAGPYSSHRLFEWTMAGAMLGISIVLALPGDTLDRSALSPLVSAGFNEGNMAAFFGIVGSLRAFALYANGYANNGSMRPSGAIVRAWCAVAGSVIWGEMALTLFIDAFRAPAVSFVLPLFIALAVSEFISCGRARYDAVERRQAKTPLEKALGNLTSA